MISVKFAQLPGRSDEQTDRLRLSKHLQTELGLRRHYWGSQIKLTHAQQVLENDNEIVPSYRS
jgi:hypothetical protein